VAERSHGPQAVEVTWGGPPPRGEAVLRSTVSDLVGAGATWVIFASPIDPDLLVAAAREAEADHGAGGTGVVGQA
jgi:hypothetical protein